MIVRCPTCGALARAEPNGARVDIETGRTYAMQCVRSATSSRCPEIERQAYRSLPAALPVHHEVARGRPDLVPAVG